MNITAADARSIILGMRRRGYLSGSQADGFLADLDRFPRNAARIVALARMYA